nr:uncharacterized protein LOC129381755 [Dermacentor andersoni]
MKRGSRGKLSMFYLSLLYLPPHERSKLSNIFLLGVGYTSHFKQHTARLEFFDNFTTVLKALSTEGMNVRTNRGTEKFFGALMTLTGDALAVHSLAGFKESFGHAVFRSCRTCLVQTADYARPSRHGECILRTERETIAQMEQLKESTCAAARSKLSKEFGINGESMLTSIPFFLLTKDILYDPMHVLLEGIVPKEIALFLKTAVKEKAWFSRKELNDALSTFSFHRAVSTSDQPRMFERDLTVTSASASLVLILHLPLILASFLPKNSMRVRSLVRLAQITQIILSPVLTAEAVGALQELIADQQEMFLKCYEGEAMLPKLHMLLHIAEQIKTPRPGRHHWTMRLEAKNALPKSNKICYFKNLPLSASGFLQTNTSHALWNDDHTPRTGYATNKLSLVRDAPYVLDEKLCEDGLPRCDADKVALCVECLSAWNVTLRVSDEVLSGTANRNPCFCRIFNIVSFEAHIFLLFKVQSNMAL